MSTRINSSSFPKEYARTQNYTIGAPRTFQVSQDGKRVFFLRSNSSFENVLDLWCINLLEEDHVNSKESILVRFNDLKHGDLLSKSDPEADRARKERLREAAGGITSYSIDAKGDVVAFAIKGDVYVTHVREEPLTIFTPVGGASDLKLSPNGKFLSFVLNNELFVTELTKSEILSPKRISPHATETISWGLAEFIAAEEMHRYDGYWWSPESNSIIFTGVDVSQVPTWYIPNPTDPAAVPRSIRFPHAGAPNAHLSLFLWSRSDKSQEIIWDKEKFPYLVSVKWRGNDPTIVVQDRTQRHVIVLDVDKKTGQTSQLYEKSDTKWVELIEGVPSWSNDKNIVDAPDTERRRLQVDGKYLSKPDAEMRKYIGQLSSGGFIYLASEDPKEIHVWVSYPDKAHIKLSEQPGIFDAEIGGDTIVVHGTTLEDKPNRAYILTVSKMAYRKVNVRSFAKKITIRPCPQFFQTQVRKINYAILYPTNFQHDRKLPILMDPYGGPWVQRCVKSSLSFTVSQWFADQGFAVIVADGRGTPGRGRRWEKAIAGNLIRAALQDQITALDDAIKNNTSLDPQKVAIRGWSFGGYLAALSVLLKPERFHAAIAGAPVTDWRYYDTHYTERYLGDPEQNSQKYDLCSAIKAASRLARPLLLIHGFGDDNVVCANTLRLSQALFEAGKDHSVLPLTDITHMTASETAAKNLLYAQLSFLETVIKAK